MPKPPPDIQHTYSNQAFEWEKEECDPVKLANILSPAIQDKECDRNKEIIISLQDRDQAFEGNDVRTNVKNGKAMTKYPLEKDGPVKKREMWNNRLDFIMSCVSMSVGLGNVWRFPMVAARNGGGAFLIPYIVVLILIGRPLYYLEMCRGQFSRYGQVKAWNMVPLFKGVGYGSLTAVGCVCSYYCSLMAVTIYYFVLSFSSQLPWAVCYQEIYGNETCQAQGAEGQLAQLYYNRIVFPQLENIDNGLGKIHWKLALCLAASWFLIFLALIKGVQSSARVAYVTAIFPYLILAILLIRGLTLKGAWTGIKYFIKPKWSALLEPRVWYAAVEQCFFSLATGFGPIIMFSSYNQFKQNIYQDVFIISFMDTVTSLLAGCTVFSVMGYLVEQYGLKFEDMSGGPGLAFILYPQAIATFDWLPQVFAILFFLMLFTLGMGSATSLTGGVITIVSDQFPSWKRWLITCVVCICGCLLGLIYVTEGGLFLLDLVDHYGAGFIIYVMAMLECTGVAYFYGLRKFCLDIEFMLGRKVGVYWRICWGFIIPVGLLMNLVYYLSTEAEFKYGDVRYPRIATICGWLLTGFAASLIPIWGVHAIFTRKATSLMGKIRESIKPTPNWGPQEPTLRAEWIAFRTNAENANRELSPLKRTFKTIFG